ncbi:MAG: hypothetical protein KC731_01740 [Myxococcales bacterium]|nr:hypothetical protein [Myxococcales bacterium]
MKRFEVLVAVGLVFGAGCSAPDTEQQTGSVEDAAITPAATLTFDAGWGELQDGPLVAGGTVTIDYDPARLAACEATQGGNLQWAVTGYAQIAGGPVTTFDVLSPNHPGGEPVTFTLDAAGDLALWFEATSGYGCHEWDSDFGNNYHFEVGAPASFPSWAGDAEIAIERFTCGSEPCPGDLFPAQNGFLFDTWARQRATVAHIYFEAWEPGITDWDNPSLWQQLDVQLHYRFAGESTFASRYVDFLRRDGNNARYAVGLRDIDPLGGNTIQNPADCPTATLSLTGRNGAYVSTTVDYYFTVSDVEIRPQPGATFTGTFEDYAGLYAPCL